jgi:hypothetical protein
MEKKQKPHGDTCSNKGSTKSKDGDNSSGDDGGGNNGGSPCKQATSPVAKSTKKDQSTKIMPTSRQKYQKKNGSGSDRWTRTPRRRRRR